jgi:hypothetical protein
VWARDGFPPTVELLAALLENLDAWHRAHMHVATGQKGKITVPAPVRIDRPAEQRDRERRERVETDPQKIRQWLAANLG